MTAWTSDSTDPDRPELMSLAPPGLPDHRSGIRGRDRDLYELSHLAASPDSGLVFFVGAGISTGKSGIPGTTALIRKLVETAISSNPELGARVTPLPVLHKIGFEMVLNDLWQICPRDVGAFFEWLAELDAAATPTIAHAFLGRWIAHGGSVVTTNYDRLIERTNRVAPRFDREAADASGFQRWPDDLEKGALFKIHGSLERPSTCLAALEHVGTTIEGARQDLLFTIFRERPVCVVGWAGADPDAPPVIRAALAERPSHLPLLWVHHNENSFQNASPILREVSLTRPIFGEALDLFTALDRGSAAATRLAREFVPTKPAAELKTLASCPPSANSRFVGIALRRGGRERLALRALDVAAAQSSGPGAWSAARQERAQTLWGSARGQVRREIEARKVVADVVATLRDEGSPPMEGPLFGLLSMTISLSARRRRLLAEVPGLLRMMRRELRRSRAGGADETDLRIREALTDSYEGRLRLALTGRFARHLPALRQWVLAPFERGRGSVVSLPARSLHSSFDVRAGYAMALAILGDCARAREDIIELDRLSLLLSDDRRLNYWRKQRATLEVICPKG